MMKTVEWHEQCLKNRENSASQIRKQIESLTIEYNCDLYGISLLRHQIESARKENKLEFDSSRYKCTLMPPIKNMEFNISLCKSCNCMTKTVSGMKSGQLKCGKCGAKKGDEE